MCEFICCHVFLSYTESKLICAKFLQTLTFPSSTISSTVFTNFIFLSSYLMISHLYLFMLSLSLFDSPKLYVIWHICLILYCLMSTLRCEWGSSTCHEFALSFFSIVIVVLFHLFFLKKWNILQWEFSCSPSFEALGHSKYCVKSPLQLDSLLVAYNYNYV